MTHHTHAQKHEPGRTIVLWAVLVAALAANVLTTTVVSIPGLSVPFGVITVGCAVLLVRAHRRRRRAASGTTRYTASEH
ncbi:hypothetical protein E2F48_17120 [Arthrobacter crusticola]|uniref:Uncharacterized protein n=1 Tax=Arthrobacter crusticola TaxID=2547960 RepID=A0A4R5TPY8_9MICC|nr:hypothetical protein [Arthrobacter crusticola]TDK23304.1 hypothetical protein E2F48_17120 [Arthrobacter crusticola]